MIILTPDFGSAQKITLEKGPESTKVCQMYPQIKKNTLENCLKMRGQNHDSDDLSICNDMAIFDDYQTQNHSKHHKLSQYTLLRS